jgi:hypothetical protein
VFVSFKRCAYLLPSSITRLYNRKLNIGGQHKGQECARHSVTKTTQPGKSLTVQHQSMSLYIKNRLRVAGNCNPKSVGFRKAITNQQNILSPGSQNINGAGVCNPPEGVEMLRSLLR